MREDVGEEDGADLEAMKERDQLNRELQTAVVSKGKVEALCRELQKVNKTVKEESLSKIREQEDRREEVGTGSRG